MTTEVANKRADQLADAVIARMQIESAQSTSDEEIERTLSKTVAPNVCIAVAKNLRARGLLNI